MLNTNQSINYLGSLKAKSSSIIVTTEKTRHRVLTLPYFCHLLISVFHKHLCLQLCNLFIHYRMSIRISIYVYYFDELFFNQQATESSGEQDVFGHRHDTRHSKNTARSWSPHTVRHSRITPRW